MKSMTTTGKVRGASNAPSASSDFHIPVESLNSLLTCSLCSGYLHNAVTITECLHSFCKGCLVKYVTVNLHCPRCKVLIHPTDPLVNIRHDSTMQDIVYKLLPHVQKEEQDRERQFYSERGLTCDPKDMIPISPYLKRRPLSRPSHDSKETWIVGLQWLVGCWTNVCWCLAELEWFHNSFAIGQQVFVSSSKHQNSKCSELSAKEASAEIRCSGAAVCEQLLTSWEHASEHSV